MIHLYLLLFLFGEAKVGHILLKKASGSGGSTAGSQPAILLIGHIHFSLLITTGLSKH